MHQGKERMEEGGRRGPRRGLMMPDLGVQSRCAEVRGSVLTMLMPTNAGPSATVNSSTAVSGDVAVPRC